MYISPEQYDEMRSLLHPFLPRSTEGMAEVVIRLLTDLYPRHYFNYEYTAEYVPISGGCREE